MDKFKKILRFLSSVLFYSIVLILVIIFLMFLAYFIDQKLAAKEGKTRSPLFGAYVIISESMIPSINVYDAVVTMRASEEQIKVNDIITFLSKEIQTAGTPITHRVIGIVYDSEDETKIIGYRTKGDNNNTADFALIAPDEVIGKVVFRIPMIGYLQTFMTKPIGWLIVIVIPCLLIIGSDIFKLVKSKQKEDDSANKIVDSNNDFNSPIFDIKTTNISEKDNANVDSNLSIRNSVVDNGSKHDSEDDNLF